MEVKPDPCRLHMLFFPLMTKGHMLPMVQIAKLFAARGALVTLITTPANADLVSRSYSSIRVHLIPFPGDDCVTLSDDFVPLLEAVTTLRGPFDDALKELRPDCVVSDFFMPWTYDVATAHGVPRLVFDGFSFFTRCIEYAFVNQDPLLNEPPDSDKLVFHDLPHRIEFLKSQFPDPEEWAESTTLSQIWNQAAEVEPKNFGVVVNSFYELEPDYVEYYRNVVGGKAWAVGPAALCDTDNGNGGNNVEQGEWLKWLDSQKTESVVYMCFGSMSGFSDVQLNEMAVGLEASGHPFVWAVRSTSEEWIPSGFEERIRGRGLLIRGWAPQLLILNHPSVGGFVTHCGWNSCLEGIVAGLPMATWPLFAEQFYNEKQLVNLLGIGVAVGAKEYAFTTKERKEVVAAGLLEAALCNLMGKGEEADGRRRRAKEMGEKARRAVEKGGSSHNGLGNLIEELVNSVSGK